MQKEILALRDEISTLLSDKSFLERQVGSLEQRIEGLDLAMNQRVDELEKSEEARKELKLEVEDMNSKMS